MLRFNINNQQNFFYENKFKFYPIWGGQLKIAFCFNLLYFILIFFLVSCESNQTDLIGAINYDSRSKEGPKIEKTVTYSCNGDTLLPPYNPTNSCYEPHCSCPLNYTREDLDPCDYADMGEYGEAVVCELNRISTNCQNPGLPFGCSEMELCIKSFGVPADLLDDIPNSNPWKYCSTSEDCGEWSCPFTGGSYYLHLYLTVEHQDVLVAYAWDIAEQEAPTCPGTNSAAVPYAVYFKICYSGNYPFSCYEETSLCSNMDIRLHVLYKCCSLFGN